MNMCSNCFNFHVTIQCGFSWTENFQNCKAIHDFDFYSRNAVQTSYCSAKINQP